MRLIAVLHANNEYDSQVIDLINIESKRMSLSQDNDSIGIKVDSEFGASIDPKHIDTDKNNLAGHFENVVMTKNMDSLSLEVYNVYGNFIPGEILKKHKTDEKIESFPYYKQFKPRVNRGATLTFDFIGCAHLEKLKLKNELIGDDSNQQKLVGGYVNPKDVVLKFDTTDRGIDITSFEDIYGLSCSLQESSLASQHCIWLGRDSNRMHLNQEIVKELLPYLQKFVDTGNLK